MYFVLILKKSCTGFEMMGKIEWLLRMVGPTKNCGRQKLFAYKTGNIFRYIHNIRMNPSIFLIAELQSKPFRGKACECLLTKLREIQISGSQNYYITLH